MSLTSFAFLLAYLSGLALAFIRHPRYGLYTYLAVFYLDPPTRWWGAFLPNLRWSLLSAVVTIAATMMLGPPKHRPAWNATMPAKLLMVFAGWMWIQNAWALAGPEHLEASILFTKYVVLYFLIYRLLETPEDVGNLLFVHVLGCGYLGWLAYLAPAAGRLEGVGGPGIDEANALAMFVGTGALCGACLILGEQSWRRWVCIVLMPFILNTLVQAESRGAMLAVVGGGFVLFYLRPRKYRKLFYVFAICGVGLFGYLAQDFFWDRMATLRGTVDESTELDSSAQNRVELAKAQLRMAAKYPHGSGHRGTAELSPLYLEEKWLTVIPGSEGPARSSHATLLSALVEQGIPGLAIFSALIFWLIAMIFRIKRLNKLDQGVDTRQLIYGTAAAASLASVMTAGLFTDYIKTEVQIWMFAILASVMLVHIPASLTSPQGQEPGRETPPTRRADSRPPGRQLPAVAENRRGT